MDLRLLATFRAVVETGGFGRAADRLGIGASTVTLRVQQLEAELGGPVFVRHGRRLAVSELGEAVRRHADAIAGHLEALGAEAVELGAAGRGTLRCGAVTPAAHLDVAPLLAGLVRSRPAVTLQLEVGGTVALAAAVADGRLPFALCSAPPPELGLRFEPLFREPLALLAPERHPLARAAGPGRGATPGPVPAAAVAAHPVIVSERGCAYRAHIEDRFAAAGLTLDLRGEVGGTAAAVAAVRAGLGVALLPAAGLTATAPAAPPAPAAPAAPPAPAGSSPPPEGTVLRAVADVDLALPLGLVRPRAGEPHSALTSEAIAAVRAAAPAWRS